MDDPDPEPGREERPVAPAPEPVGGEVAAQPGDVVAAVVVDDEQAAIRPQGAVGFGKVAGVGSVERGPAGDDGVDRFGRQAERQGPRAGRCGDARHVAGDRLEIRELPRPAADDRDVAPGKGPKRLERAGDLAFDVERAEERVAHRDLGASGGGRPRRQSMRRSFA